MEAEPTMSARRGGKSLSIVGNSDVAPCLSVVIPVFNEKATIKVLIERVCAQRPVEETAPPHGTIYVPRPLPERLTAGHTLTAEDRTELEILLARRDAQIRFLYEREQEYSQVLNGMLKSATWRIGRIFAKPVKLLLCR